MLAISTCGLGGCEQSSVTVAERFSKPLYSWGAISGKTLTVRGNGDDLRRPFVRRAFARYEELTGNTLRVEALNNQELAQNLNDAFHDGTASRPDILLSFGGTNIAPLYPESHFYDFTNAPWIDDITDTALTQAIYNGKVYGLPFWEASVSGMLYNKTLFERLGLTPPRTQQAFLEVCERLLQAGITPVYLPFKESSMLLYQFPLDELVGRGRVLDELNADQLQYADMPGMADLVGWYRLMVEKGYFGMNYETNDWNGMDKAMLSESHAMMICWDTWLYTNFSGNPGRFGLMPAFMGVPDEGTFEGPNMAMFLVNKDSPELETALDFITFLADPYNYNKVFANMLTAPVFKNQIGSFATPQFLEAEKDIERLLHDSTAWLRIRGFSQLDARYIQRHMRDKAYSIEECLRDMDLARMQRAALGQ